MPNNETASESDWEYEYDETETEDFYFTLDLPATAEPASKRRKTTASEKDTTPAIDAGLGSTRSQDTPSKNPAHQSHAPSEPISFTGLHTSTPAVEYGNQRYTCRWTTDLGTQFHVARPGDVKDPHRPGHAVDVVALSRVRLTGQRTVAAPNSKKADAMGTSAGRAIALDEDEDDGESGGRPQMSFFERVKEVQMRKEREAANGINGSGAESSIPPGPPSAPARSNAASLDHAGVTHSANDTSQLPPNVQTAPVSETSETMPMNGAQQSRPTEAQARQGSTIDQGRAPDKMQEPT